MSSYQIQGFLPVSTINIDLHTHTCASKDSSLKPATLIAAARRKGLDRICVTDHNTLDGALAAQKLAPDFVIVGEEIKIDRGCEILAYFVREWVPPGLSAAETVDRLQAQGAVISISHPFDRHRNQPWAEEWLEEIIDRIDALEGLNARAVHAEDNQKAIDFAATHNLPITAGSDAHTAMEVGAAWLELPAFTTAAEFREGLGQSAVRGQRSPSWVHLFSMINTWRWRLGIKPMFKEPKSQ
jgi:predicted metal-dependent phosphoesterase TrpH